MSRTAQLRRINAGDYGEPSLADLIETAHAHMKNGQSNEFTVSSFRLSCALIGFGLSDEQQAKLSEILS